MTKYRLTTVLAVICAAAPLYFGLSFLLAPGSAPAGFGIEPWPTGNADGYFVVKGVRDLAIAAVTFLLLGLGLRRVLGWVVLIHAAIPVGDALAVVSHGGSVSTALIVHGSAVVVVALTAVLLLTERTRPAGTDPVARGRVARSLVGA
ncbi:DUF4267 domain-containing protein [Nocardia cyriacigeorgica]|jgi:Domain of unknown function (DUF4267)|uniref:DUF4267 domain-containing protein n=1 Tax=Nocardia cyriacigeorgica TaxID=135487 RepID=UPI0013D7BA7D|nr:DUF4267 domain-containing protein [Nocardia cyriacigeorgica]MBF6435168.1 DUF4267 domain-containing protein [Nocardia cyriacigeorgica]NEW29194.1 DUF4267 domain-containing protein [Nocardia cyriacigeorgica]